MLRGIEAEQIWVESDTTRGLPSFSIVGLPDAANRESRERIRSAIINTGMKFPDGRVTVNLSPADLRKEGTHFDLPAAVAILASDGKIPRDHLESWVMMGELSLDGRLKAVRGVLPLITGIRSLGMHRVIIPAENAAEGALADGIEVRQANTLEEVIRMLTRREPLPSVRKTGRDAAEKPAPFAVDYLEVAGQESAKRAIQIAAAGMHNILMVGSPGSGKSMLAKRIPTILPPLTFEEKIEISKIYSICGLLNREHPLIHHRPFRTPDHTITPTALIGGGMKIRPGEVSLAHLGVLFLDELPEFRRSSIEALRKPMEDEKITVSRLSGTAEFPSKFILAAGMNPCPCGYAMDETRECVCTPWDRARYRARLSGPFLDRIDMAIYVRRPDFHVIQNGCGGMSSEQMRKNVWKVWKKQKERFAEVPVACNSQMRPDHIRQFCQLEKDGEEFMEHAFRSYRLSLRSYHKILRVARTIADLNDSEKVRVEDLAEAVNYKCSLEFLQEGQGTV